MYRKRPKVPELPGFPWQRLGVFRRLLHPFTRFFTDPALGTRPFPTFLLGAFATERWRYFMIEQHINTRQRP